MKNHDADGPFDAPKEHGGFVVHNGIIGAAIDDTVGKPVRDQLPDILNQETKTVGITEARQTIQKIETRLVRTFRTKQPSPGDRRLIGTVNRNGAELMIELMNSGKYLPQSGELANFAERIRATDERLFPEAKQHVAVGSTKLDDLARTLMLHAQLLDAAAPRDLVAEHRYDMEDTALAVWSMIGLTVETEGCFVLNPRAQILLAGIQTGYEEATRIEPVQ